MKANATIQLAWFGSADVCETIEQVQEQICYSPSMRVFADHGMSTLTLTDGTPITFFNRHFVSVTRKDPTLVSPDA